MKLFLAIALIATVASAAIIKPAAVSGELAEIAEIVAAINSPSTDPATAAALEQMLLDVLGVNPEPVAVGPAIVESESQPEPIAVGPAIIESEHEPISVGPAIIDFPLPDGGAIAEVPVAPSPVVIAPGPVADAAAASAPLVQIILNINQAAAEGVAPAPVVVPEPIKPEPVQVVESAPEPVQVVEPAPIPPIAVNPIGAVEAAPEPVQVVEAAPVPAEPVVIGTPVLPSPAVVLPEILN